LTAYAPRSTATIEVRPVHAVHGVVVSVVGHVDPQGAAILSCRLNGVLDVAPSVVVVDLGAVGEVDQAALEVLAVARERARDVEIDLHLIDRGQPAVRRRLAAAGLL
jgi:anti-anti-sigma regulatory factor